MPIRNARVNDKFTITEVARKCAPIRNSVVGTYEYLARCFQNTFFVHEEDGEIVGFIVGFPNTSVPGEFWLYQIGVLELHRGKKIGFYLFERFLKQVKEEGYKTCKSHYVFGNEISARLHAKLGFTICGGDERGPFVEKKL